jgi:hypothetical protein
VRSLKTDLELTFFEILGAGQTATIVLQVKNGRGRHASEMSIEHINKMLLVGLD